MADNSVEYRVRGDYLVPVSQRVTLFDYDLSRWDYETYKGIKDRCKGPKDLSSEEEREFQSRFYNLNFRIIGRQGKRSFSPIRSHTRYCSEAELPGLILDYYTQKALSREEQIEKAKQLYTGETMDIDGETIYCIHDGYDDHMKQNATSFYHSTLIF